MTQWGLIGAATAAALGLAGCSVSTTSINEPTAVGGAVVGTLGAAPPPAGPPAMGAFLEGPAGQRLGADRERAYQAEVDAVTSGTRTSWRGKTTFGYVAPGVPGPDGCRPFTHTIYLGGRPQTGTGTGCPTPAGSWSVTG